MRIALDEAAGRAARGGLRQRARLLDAAQRPDRDVGRSSRSSATTPTGLPLSGTKGYYGHALGASGAIEAAICALASRRGWLPPTVNLETPDPACDLRTSRARAATLAPEYLLSNSFGFGGINAALVFRRAVTPRFARRPYPDTHQGEPMPSLLRRSLAEAVGTFALVFIGTAVVAMQVTSPTRTIGALGIALAHAMALSVMVTATMSISGGHLNPAVTIGLLAARRINAQTAAAYIVAQLVGAVLAALLRQGALPARRHPPDRARHARRSPNNIQLWQAIAHRGGPDLLPGVGGVRHAASTPTRRRSAASASAWCCCSTSWSAARSPARR